MQTTMQTPSKTSVLRSLEALHGYAVCASNGNMGKVNSFLFDDESRLVRYLVVDTGDWLSERLVLIDPAAILSVDDTQGTISLALTTQQVENGPSIDADAPVSRQHMTELHQHYDWPIWWAGDGMQYYGIPPIAPMEDPEDGKQAATRPEGDPHLRSTREVIGYNVAAADGEIGHLEDLIVQDKEWILRYVVIDTTNWLPGGKVVIALPWVQRFDWPERAVHFAMTKDQIKHSPKFDPFEPVNREFEERLYDFYDQPHYWA